MNYEEIIVELLNATLQPAQAVNKNSLLLGVVPEFDSMSVVTVLVALEEQLGLLVEDDDIDADIFTSVSSLSAFVSSKLEVTL